MESSLALDLYNIGAVKFGSFTLKSGILSPIYFDLRVIISYPKLLRQIAHFMWKKVEDYKFDCVCGVPYTALPIATALSLDYNVPMVMRRKEVKAYGTKKMIEGVFRLNDSCLILEDLVTSGSSIFETIEPLENEGLVVTDVVVILDREQGGRNKIESKGYRFHSLLSISQLLNELEMSHKIDSTVLSEVKCFIKENQC